LSGATGLEPGGLLFRAKSLFCGQKRLKFTLLPGVRTGNNFETEVPTGSTPMSLDSAKQKNAAFFAKLCKNYLTNNRRHV
jgi:hypothetical protein